MHFICPVNEIFEIFIPMAIGHNVIRLDLKQYLILGWRNSIFGIESVTNEVSCH